MLQHPTHLSCATVAQRRAFPRRTALMWATPRASSLLAPTPYSEPRGPHTCTCSSSCTRAHSNNSTCAQVCTPITAPTRAHTHSSTHPLLCAHTDTGGARTQAAPPASPSAGGAACLVLGSGPCGPQDGMGLSGDRPAPSTQRATGTLCSQPLALSTVQWAPLQKPSGKEAWPFP